MSRFENMPTVKPAKGKTRVVSIVYPVFASCAEVTEQKFWKDLFTSMSQGKFGKNIKMTDTGLIIRRKNKTFCCPLSEDPIETEKNIREFLQFHNIMSAEDKRIKIGKVNEVLAPSREDIYTDWNKIKGKARLYEIQNFSLQMQTIMNLSEDQRRDLVEVINLGIISGMFNNKTIHVVKGFINTVDGLGYNPTTGKFYIDTSLPIRKTRASSSGKVKKVDFFIEKWKKYYSATSNKKIVINSTDPTDDFLETTDSTETKTDTQSSLVSQ